MYSWTDERCDELRRLRAEGLSFSLIAAELGGVTRNACIGKAGRLGLTGCRPPLRRKPKEAKPQSSPRGHVQRPTQHFAIIEMDEEPVRDFSADEVPIAQRKTILELRAHDCRWPYGDPHQESFFFCGATSIEGQPYCKHHARIAFKPPPPRINRLAPFMRDR